MLDRNVLQKSAELRQPVLFINLMTARAIKKKKKGTLVQGADAPTVAPNKLLYYDPANSHPILLTRALQTTVGSANLEI